MDRKISAPVGMGYPDKASDVKTIQEMLNLVPKAWGGPDPKLKIDGIAGFKTVSAILELQRVQLGTKMMPTGAIEPASDTFGRLNHMINSGDKPGAAIKISFERIDHVRQPTSMTCWAAAGTMLVSARDLMCVPIEAVMKEADAGDPTKSPTYSAMFSANKGLEPEDTGRYTAALGLRVGPKACFTVGGWAEMMTKNGAIGVVGKSPGLHIRVITELIGDGSVFGTFLTVHDPARATPYQEVMVTFDQRYEAAATVSDRMDQLWHQ